MSYDEHGEHDAIKDVIRRLTDTFTRTHTPTEVEEAVMTAYDGFDGRPVRDFIPLLVERIVKDQLRRGIPRPESELP
ncbi:hypothetical protein J5X84_01810 [Streptosporangiaceae bacterium NEAU-GS5]|nr:hypothetical protein [Streptosporangiaceae bacterium NEAU-GS5]